jgi:hypothetical protein
MCGNFGLLLLLPLDRKSALRLLRRMLKITSVRGAQSAGVATYELNRKGEATGVRCRVVNGKRTDLADLLLAKLERSLSGASFPSTSEPCRLFQGHTRFATSSIVNIGGCHPHQWLPRRVQAAWHLTDAGTVGVEQRAAESFITHNGDLDFFNVHGITYALSDVQRLLARLLGHPMPSDVDSACVAGLLDLLRCKGLWLSAVRYGYLYGALSEAGSLSDKIDGLATGQQLASLAAVFEAEWADIAKAANSSAHMEHVMGEGYAHSRHIPECAHQHPACSTDHRTSPNSSLLCPTSHAAQAPARGLPRPDGFGDASMGEPDGNIRVGSSRGTDP